VEKIAQIEQAESRAQEMISEAQQAARDTIRAARVAASSHLDSSRAETARLIRTHGSKHILHAQHDAAQLETAGEHVRAELAQTAEANMGGVVSAALRLLNN